MFAAIEYNFSVYEDVFDPFVILKGILVGGSIDHAFFVEDGDVGKGAFAKNAAIMQTNFGGVERSHFANSIFDSNHATLAGIDAEDTRKGSEAARVRVTAAQRTFHRERGAVRTDGGPRLFQSEV